MVVETVKEEKGAAGGADAQQGAQKDGEGRTAGGPPSDEDLAAALEAAKDDPEAMQKLLQKLCPDQVRR
jgi:hypothetical protein